MRKSMIHVRIGRFALAYSIQPVHEVIRVVIARTERVRLAWRARNAQNFSFVSRRTHARRRCVARTRVVFRVELLRPSFFCDQEDRGTFASIVLDRAIPALNSAEATITVRKRR